MARNQPLSVHSQQGGSIHPQSSSGMPHPTVVNISSLNCPTFQQVTDDWTHIQKIEEPALDAHIRDPNLLPPINLRDRSYITCYDPSTSYHLDTKIADNAAEIASKIEAARQAQPEWKRTSFQQRRRFMRSLNKWLVDNQNTCARVAARDTGKTREFTGVARCPS